jgi:hypothetical protein
VGQGDGEDAAGDESMARTRIIKPGFFLNDVLGECPPLARLLFAGLWCRADREGRLECRPKRLKPEILPFDDCDIVELLRALEAKGFIELYAVDGRDYIQVVNFTKHQKPHPREPKSEIPPRDERDRPQAVKSREKVLPRQDPGNAEPRTFGPSISSFRISDSKGGVVSAPAREAPVAAEHAAALGVIQLFDEELAEHFGAERRRPWPAATDQVIAQRWLDAGADFALCRSVFRAGFARMRGRGRDPPANLSYFERPIADAITQAKQPMPEGRANGAAASRPKLSTDADDIRGPLAAAALARSVDDGDAGTGGAQRRGDGARSRDGSA